MYLASAFLLLFFTAILCCTWCLNELIYWSKLCACQEVLNLSRICTLSVEHIWIVSSCSCSSTLRPLGATLHTTAVTHFFSCDTSGARCLQGDSRRNVRVHAREALIILVFNSVLCFFMRIKVKSGVVLVTEQEECVKLHAVFGRVHSYLAVIISVINLSLLLLFLSQEETLVIVYYYYYSSSGRRKLLLLLLLLVILLFSLKCPITQ